MEFIGEHIAAERELALELRKYVGLWVAVENHTVVACSETLGNLLDDIRFDGRIDTAATMLVKRLIHENGEKHDAAI